MMIVQKQLSIEHCHYNGSTLMLLLPALLTYLLCIASWILGAVTTDQTQEGYVREFFGKDGANTTSSHTNNWAVLVCA
jgi:hypothetical protein